MRLADALIRQGRSASLLAVEGAPRTARDLAQRLAPLSETGIEVRVVCGLVGERAGKARLEMGREANVNFVRGNSALGVWQSDKGSCVVSYLDVAQFVPEGAVIDLLKCDIEGSEFSFFQNYPDLLGRTRHLVVEFHPDFGDVEEALVCLRKSGLEHIRNLRSDPVTRLVLASR